MHNQLDINNIIAFDLDDTLYKEIDFLKSAYQEISHIIGIPEAYGYMLTNYLDGKNAFKEVVNHYHLNCSIEALLHIYRNHKPNISLDNETRHMLQTLKQNSILGIISDGRLFQQMNKINALGLLDFIERDNILISEEFGYKKPSEEPYKYFMDKYPNSTYTYIGDNTEKDFIAPNELGWKTICLIDNGQNIHKQNFSLPKEKLPKVKINNISIALRYINPSHNDNL